MIKPAKKAEILTSRESRIKTKVRAGVVAELPADRGGFAHRIESRNTRDAATWKKKSGQDAQERGFSGAIRSEQRHGFTLLDLQGNAAKRGHRRCDEGLNKGAPAGEGGGKRFFERVGGDGRFEHYRGYSVSLARKQCAGAVGDSTHGKEGQSPVK